MKPRAAFLVLVVAAGVAALTATACWLVVQVAPSLVPEDLTPYADETARVQAANGRNQAVATTRTGMLAGLAGLAAVGALVVNAINARIGQRTLALETEGQVTDRYSKAIELLGDKDATASRLGGIYALERIANDSERDQRTVVEVLSSFVRESTREARAEDPREGQEDWAQWAKWRVVSSAPETDVQAALDVLGRLPPRDGVPRADLAGAHLEYARLNGARLQGAQLNAAHLEHARLNGARLEGAQLDLAHLDNAWLHGAHLEGAWLKEAYLNDAQLFEAHLEGTWLHVAGGLTQEQLTSCTGDAETVLPWWVSRPRHWPAAGRDDDRDPA